MKKKTKKLRLAKDTVLKLENNDYKQVLGAISVSWCYFCLPTQPCHESWIC
jgi:hypothetical protein